jgi:hypothetical protein
VVMPARATLVSQGKYSSTWISLRDTACSDVEAIRGEGGGRLEQKVPIEQRSK